MTERSTPAAQAAPPPSAEQLEAERKAITAHCYRMLGCASEADDAAQETMLRAWRGLDRFEGRATVRTWLHRIATRVCLDHLESRKRRARPMDLQAAGTVDDPLVELPREHWLEPMPDAALLPREGDPAERLALRQSVRLAFVAALQQLPPKQRAALVLAEVLDFSAAEIAESLSTSVAAVNSSLQRARATLASRPPRDAEPLTEASQALLERYMDAFERYDMEALGAVLRDDATLCMPPLTLWLQGPDAIRDWMLGRGAACRGSRLVPTSACGLPAFGQYKPGEAGGPLLPWSLIVLELEGERIATIHHFLDTEALFPRFGLPPEISPSTR